MSVMRKLGQRGKEEEDRATKVFQNWRLQRLAKKMLLTTNEGVETNEVPSEYFSNTTYFTENAGPTERLDQYKTAYEELKKELVANRKKLESFNVLESNINQMKKGIRKIAKTLEIPLISNIQQESVDFYLKSLNMINFEIEYLKRSEEESAYKKALNEVDHLKMELENANKIIDELSEVNFQNEIELQLSQRELTKHQNKLVSKIDTTIIDMDKSQLMNKIEELEEEHHHSVVETGRYMEEIKDLQDRVKKYESQLVYFKNNNELQNKEIEHLKNTKRLYEECMEDLNKAENEISTMKKELLELNEIKRKYTKAERRIKRMKRTEDWNISPSKGEATVDLCAELENALGRVEELEKELEEEREANNAAIDGKELEILYENSQREIEHLNKELQNTWKRLNELDNTELLEKLKKVKTQTQELKRSLRMKLRKMKF